MTPGIVLLGKDADTDRRLAEQQIAALQQTLAKQQEQLAELKLQLEQADASVKEISAWALDSASGGATTEALQRLL